MRDAMPEQLTKHPEVTLQVLRSAGARCGDTQAPEILTRCPAQSLCKLPGGEICVYGLADAHRMTQITRADLQSLVGATVPAPPSAADDPANLLLLTLAAAVVGAAAGAWLMRRHRS
ncbi:MAG: hypothetical protein IT390_04235 [Nitrospira sp.]|nr:hypothetical protein [Nitrospira sp.]